MIFSKHEGRQLSLSDPDHLPPTSGAPLQRPLMTTAVVIYTTLALLVITIPRGLVNWAKNYEPSPPQAVALAAAEAVQSISHRIGADWVFAQCRGLFLKVTGKRED